MFIEILALIFGGALMGVGMCLIKGKANIKKCHTYSFRLGSCLYVLGLSIFASWNLDDLIDDLIKDRLPDVFKYVSLNSFWAILWAGVGLTFVFEDLRKRWDNASKDSQSEKQQPSSQDQKKK